MSHLKPSSDNITGAIRERLARALPAAGAGETWNDAELRRFRLLQSDYPARTGKLLRGRVVALSAAAHGVPPVAADHGVRRSEAMLIVAAAIELFQAWVLVHDDIEDDSETRRGLPALHRTVGLPIALNVGDAMHVRMWRLLHELNAAAVDLSGGLPVAAILDEFGDMIERTAEGQHLDLAYLQERRVAVTESEYLDMVTRKTAYYTVVSPLRLGALLAGRRPASEFTAAGIDLGVAFQIRDDVLNLTGQGEDDAYGKEFAGDLYEGKRTLILAHAMASAAAPERSRLTALLTPPREERTAEHVEELLELIERHGSIEYAQRQAADRASRGLETLAAALAHAPEPAAATELLELLADVAERQH